MSHAQARLFAVIDHLAPLPLDFAQITPQTGLAQLGFDSLSMVSLFIELESEFDLSVEQMRRHLTKTCTVESLLRMCVAA